jgi:hypothetical protein
MKQIVILSLLLFAAINGFSQEATPSTQDVQRALLKKSKNLGTTSIVLVSGGSALFVTGLVVYPKDYDWLFGTTPEKESQANTAGALVLSGLVCVAASIPFFIASAITKRKARNVTSLGFKMEKATVLNGRSFSQPSYPALALKISL